jgi:hypothetical protein
MVEHATEYNLSGEPRLSVAVDLVTTAEDGEFPGAHAARSRQMDRGVLACARPGPPPDAVRADAHRCLRDQEPEPIMEAATRLDSRSSATSPRRSLSVRLR